MSTAKKRRIPEPESIKKKRKSNVNDDTKSQAVTKSHSATKHHSTSKTTSPTVSAECSLYIPIPPIYALDPMSGICDNINSLVMQYVPQLDGVLLAYDSISPSSTARIINDSPFAHVWVTFQATIWRPSIGQILVGRINQQSPDHIGLLLQGTFNASIPREEITSAYKYNKEAEEWTVSMDGEYYSLYSVSGGYVRLRAKEINRDRSGLVSIVGSLADIDTYGVFSTKFIENEAINAYDGWDSHAQDDERGDARENNYQDEPLEEASMEVVQVKSPVHMAESDESDFDTAALTPKRVSKKKSKKVKTEENELSTPRKKKNSEQSTSIKKDKTDDGSEKKKKKKKHKIKTEQA